ncbi:MAG: PAS domain-containing protein [Methanoregula sp.]|jgi:PAS domain S-box-containing protein
MKHPSDENSCCRLLESFSHVLFTLDDRGKSTYVSVGCAENLGFLPEEMTGRLLSAFVISDDNGRIGELCDPAKQGMNHPCGFSVVGKDGGLHQASIISRSIFDGPDKTGMIGIIGEI